MNRADSVVQFGLERDMLGAGVMDLDRLRKLRTLAEYFEQPFGKRIATTIRMMERHEVLRDAPA